MALAMFKAVFTFEVFFLVTTGEQNSIGFYRTQLEKDLSRKSTYNFYPVKIGYKEHSHDPGMTMLKLKEEL